MKKQLILSLSLIALLVVTSLLYLAYTSHLSSKENRNYRQFMGDQLYKILFSEQRLDPLLMQGKECSWQHLMKFEYAARNLGTPEATAMYDNLASNNTVPELLRELAHYFGVIGILHSNNEELEGLSDVIDKLTVNKVYHYSSKEAIAILKVYNEDIDGAIEILTSLLDDIHCPLLIRVRAQELLQIYVNPTLVM